MRNTLTFLLLLLLMGCSQSSNPVYPSPQQLAYQETQAQFKEQLSRKRKHAEETEALQDLAALREDFATVQDVNLQLLAENGQLKKQLQSYNSDKVGGTHDSFTSL